MLRAPGVLRFAALAILIPQAVSAGGEEDSIPTNRRLEALRDRAGRDRLRKLIDRAGAELGEWRIHLAGAEFDGMSLRELAATDPRGPFVRVVREGLRIPVDVEDLVLFLDDLLVAGKKGLRGRQVWVIPGNARSAGILIHPDDVFRKGRPRRYGERGGRLGIVRPAPQATLPPARDGDPPRPEWTARFQNPDDEPAMLAALAEKNPVFAARVESLLGQLRAQGCEVGLDTTVRNRERGYLMWGAYLLAHAGSRRGVLRAAAELERTRRDWGLEVPIRWLHPDGWRATIRAAREMADTYPVTYARKAGAKRSRHYDGEAVDFTAVGLPRILELRAPDGAIRRFDLSASDEPRDINLTPALIGWIERHFELKKLRADYPHWNDARPPGPPPVTLSPVASPPP